jgi:endonuclease YncB( thermonuclease family)
MRKPLMGYYAIVSNVIDGDTLQADLNLGFGVHLHIPLRLRGYDAPELAPTIQPGAREALAALSALLPIGTRIMVTTLGRDRDKYGRGLVRVLLEDGSDVVSHLDPRYLRPGAHRNTTETSQTVHPPTQEDAQETENP